MGFKNRHVQVNETHLTLHLATSSGGGDRSVGFMAVLLKLFLQLLSLLVSDFDWSNVVVGLLKFDWAVTNILACGPVKVNSSHSIKV